jgi:hypothetical protein
MTEHELRTVQNIVYARAQARVNTMKVGFAGDS